jgi:hypothetical protein
MACRDDRRCPLAQVGHRPYRRYRQVDELRGRYRQTCERSRQVAAEAAGLDQLSVRPIRNDQHFSLRWVLLHLIEETARHAGHADFLREAIDGTVGE